MSVTAFLKKHHDLEVEIYNEDFHKDLKEDKVFNPRTEFVNIYPDCRMSNYSASLLFPQIGFPDYDPSEPMEIKNKDLPAFFGLIETQRTKGCLSPHWRQLALVVATAMKLNDDVVVA